MSEQEDHEKEQGFVIKDSRRFDSDGEQREGARNAEDVSAGSQSRPEAASGARQAARREAATAYADARGKSTPIDFASFVMSLATQALMQLGEVDPPEGLEMPIDTEIARQTIDILGLLRDKTKGNLDPQEEHLMEEMLHSLRMSYIKKTA